MKSFIAFMLLSVIACTQVLADSLEYDLEVEGMKCAYCAYNVSKQLESLNGVVSESIEVDLERGRVTLLSLEPLPREKMGELFRDAGFELKNVAEVVSTTVPRQQQAERQVFMSLNMDSALVSNGELDTLLEALGTIAAEQAGEISIVAPGELESAILKPVLAGRRAVIKVDYERVSYGADTVIRVSFAGRDL